jgi:hypothetical protein
MRLARLGGRLWAERLLAKVEAELARSARPRRYCFYFGEEAEAEAQGLPWRYISVTLVP